LRKCAFPERALLTDQYEAMLRLHYYKLSVIAAVLAALLLASCGKKGPLYMPDSRPIPGQKQPKN